MKVSELKAWQGNINIELEIVSVGEARGFATVNGTGQVANAAAKDEEGNEIKLTLWNEQIKEVNEGDKVRIESGYCSLFKGEKQLSTGKFGKLTVLGK